MSDQHLPIMVVSNRLPVDYTEDEAGEISWQISPGGLVSALNPVMQSHPGQWVGWPGEVDLELEPFDSNGVKLIPVSLSSEEYERYYSGFSNDTIWPLYHDVIHHPGFHREWWTEYQRVNERFSQTVADHVAPGTLIWVHDYQLQLVPEKLRNLGVSQPIGYFHHIPFPSYGIFSQLPWRKQILQGLLGADIVAFQRPADAGNFLSAVSRLLDADVQVFDGDPGHSFVDKATVRLPGQDRITTVWAHPISIDFQAFQDLAATDAVRQRAEEIRKELGSPSKLLLGVDRLDYTKGIQHRLKAFGELLESGMLKVGDVAMVQVASPTRGTIESYMELRDEIELTIGRLNGEYGTMELPAVTYLHHSYPQEEMAALYLAADVMLVTSLRDGMNLIAKEYVAAKVGAPGTLVLSEFTGAADQLTEAILVNPHDIEGLKSAIFDAVNASTDRQIELLRSMQEKVRTHDVNRWAREFLGMLSEQHQSDAYHGANHNTHLESEA